jgi:hypothetical protein
MIAIWSLVAICWEGFFRQDSYYNSIHEAKQQAPNQMAVQISNAAQLTLIENSTVIS